MNRKAPYLLLVAAVACAGVAMALAEWWIWRLEAPAVHLAANPRASMSIMQLAPGPARAAEAVPASAAGSASGLGGQTMQALLSAGTPESLYAAYRHVRHCRTSRALEYVADAAAVTQDSARLQELKSRFGYESPGQACADVTPRLESEALQWLAAAAEDGVRGAASDLAYERPAGDWWDDEGGEASPTSRSRLTRLLEIAAGKGDPDAIRALARFYIEGQAAQAPDVDGRTRALAYALAWKNSLGSASASPEGAQAESAADIVAALEAQMSRYQVDQAEAESRAMNVVRGRGISSPRNSAASQ